MRKKDGLATQKGSERLALYVQDAANSVNVSYQILPVLLRVVLKPFLGQSSVTTQPDPFTDPTILAFPANPLLIGGVAGLIITALSLLPIGRLDGGFGTQRAARPSPTVYSVLPVTSL
eukprot:g9557.t1